MKEIVIIGGGVSGLTAGIYLQANGYSTKIIEKNATLGGACIGWERKDCYIDGCIHWLAGTAPKTKLYKFWKETAFISNDAEIYHQDELMSFDYGNGKSFTFYSNLERLEKELIAFAPEDTKAIKKFCKHIQRFSKIQPPMDKPVDMMNIFQLLKIGFTMLGDFFWVSKMSRLSCKDYGKRFKNPYLKDAISNYMAADYNFMSFLYMYGHVSANDGGIPMGGSLPAVNRMKEKYLSLGGNILSAAEVKSIIIDNNQARGVILKDGKELLSDWVISTAPVEHSLKVLLGDKYKVNKIDFRLKDIKTYPIYTYSTVVMKFNKMPDKARLSLKIRLSENITFDRDYDNLTFRNYSYDKTFKRTNNAFVVQATISGNDDMFFWWNDAKKKGIYKQEKQKFADKVLEITKQTFPDVADDIEVIDVVTPCTYKRYLNSRNGSFQGFVSTSKGKSLMQKGVIKGLKHFILGGQWLVRSGGLPTAIMTGRFSAQRICKADKKKFSSPTI